MSSWPLFIVAILLIGGAGAGDVPFVLGVNMEGVAGYTSDELENLSASSPDLRGVPTVSMPSDDEVLEFPVAGNDSSPASTSELSVIDLKRILDARVEPDNARVHDEALAIALKFPGEKTIDQITSIYDYLKNGDATKMGWRYVSDPRGIEYFMYANQTLKNGDRANCVGGGDCDDFAILMSALIESVGGTTRIILAWNNSTGGHAYTEVYIGKILEEESPIPGYVLVPAISDQQSEVEGIIGWLKEKFDTDKIYTHIDTETRDAWLNLDWGLDEKGKAHPGGPFFQGDKHIVLYIRDTYEKTPLKLSDTIGQDLDGDWNGGSVDSEFASLLDEGWKGTYVSAARGYFSGGELITPLDELQHGTRHGYTVVYHSAGGVFLQLATGEWRFIATPEELERF